MPSAATPGQRRQENSGTANRRRLARIVRRLWTHSSIKQWHELPDDITRKDGHGNVAVTPRPATRGDSADGYSHQQKECAKCENGHEKGKKKKLCCIGNCHAARRQYRGDHSQTPSWHAQSAEAGEHQP